MEDYIKRKLKINPLNYISNFDEFFKKYLDKTQTGTLTTFEFEKLAQTKTDFKLSFLDYIKEGLNAILTYENLVNTELQKIFKKLQSQNSESISL